MAILGAACSRSAEGQHGAVANRQDAETTAGPTGTTHTPAVFDLDPLTSPTTPSRELDDIAFDVTYESFAEKVIVSDIVVVGEIESIVRGRSTVLGPARAFVVRSLDVLRGDVGEYFLFEDGSYTSLKGESIGIGGRPWLNMGDRVAIFGVTSGQDISSDLVEYEIHGDSAVVLLSSAEQEAKLRGNIADALVKITKGLVVKPVSREETRRITETVTAPAIVIAETTSPSGHGYTLAAAPTEVGFCFEVVPVGHTTGSPSTCTLWSTVDAVAGESGAYVLPIPWAEGVLVGIGPSQQDLERLTIKGASLRLDATGLGPVPPRFRDWRLVFDAVKPSGG